MGQKGQRHHQRNLLLPIGLDQLEHFPLFCRAQLLFEVPQQVHQHVDLLAHGGAGAHGRHEQPQVCIG